MSDPQEILGRAIINLPPALRADDPNWGITIMRKALEEIAGDPTGLSSFQADLAKSALNGTYEPES